MLSSRLFSSSNFVVSAISMQLDVVPSENFPREKMSMQSRVAIVTTLRQALRASRLMCTAFQMGLTLIRHSRRQVYFRVEWVRILSGKWAQIVYEGRLVVLTRIRFMLIAWIPLFSRSVFRPEEERLPLQSFVQLNASSGWAGEKNFPSLSGHKSKPRIKEIKIE